MKKEIKKERFAGEDVLNEILFRGMQDANSITELERDVVRARRTYLTDEQIVKLLGEKVKAPKVQVPDAPKTPTDDDVEEVDLEVMSVPELKKLAKDQEINLGKAKTREEIIAVLAENLK